MSTLLSLPHVANDALTSAYRAPAWPAWARHRAKTQIQQALKTNPSQAGEIADALKKGNAGIHQLFSKAAQRFQCPDASSIPASITVTPPEGLAKRYGTLLKAMASDGLIDEKQLHSLCEKPSYDAMEHAVQGVITQFTKRCVEAVNATPIENPAFRLELTAMTDEPIGGSYSGETIKDLNALAVRVHPEASIRFLERQQIDRATPDALAIEAAWEMLVKSLKGPLASSMAHVVGMTSPMIDEVMHDTLLKMDPKVKNPVITPKIRQHLCDSLADYYGDAIALDDLDPQFEELLLWEAKRRATTLWESNGKQLAQWRKKQAASSPALQFVNRIVLLIEQYQAMVKNEGLDTVELNFQTGEGTFFPVTLIDISMPMSSCLLEDVDATAQDNLAAMEISLRAKKGKTQSPTGALRLVILEIITLNEAINHVEKFL